ncbi:MAG: hypothetical protein WDZ89_04710 [Gemmatimonadota bacterium]|jgi:polyhydroxyalkanoate synthesis regulator phasin
MNDEKRTRKDGFSEGLRQGLGVLAAFREAVEETINDARDRGDLSPERAREMARTALDRAQEAAGDARERFDFVHRREFETLKSRVTALEERLRPHPEDEPVDADPIGGDTIP